MDKKVMKINKRKLLVGSILVCQAAGLIGSIFTAPAIENWYVGLMKPSFSPPNWLFAPVWTTLYTLMGISIYLILKKGWRKPEVKKVVAIFGVHLLLNSLWSVIFFGMRSPGLALAEIVILWIVIGYLVVKMGGLNKWAGRLLIPYWMWVSFAAVLNFEIWRLN